ncbi:MAG TPA: QueT transporter family protein [Candidatus Polarisedimenticolia bacterium]|nr:QueT transporter family protein [Candidatus Polarisedimenticolia bacterium]
MRELFTLWKDIRLVVLTSVLAALHAAAVIPFKPIQLLPGVTDLRPGMALPIVFSLLFGPAAAWGAALGNTISDLFGTLGPGSLFGFAGNLLYGYLPHRIWRAWRKDPPSFRSAADWAVYGLGLAAASGSCALVIAWGVHFLQLYPFVSTASIVLVNNVLVGLVLGPPLYLALRPRVAALDLGPHDQEAPRDRAAASRKALSRAGGLLAAAVSLGGLGAGYAAWAAGSPDAALALAVAPFVVGTVAAACLS